MYTVIGRFNPQAFAIMRIVVGLLFAFHGSQKILGVRPMEGMGGAALPTIAVVAGWIDLIGGLLVTIGLLTGIVAFICSGVMPAACLMGPFGRAIHKGVTL